MHTTLGTDARTPTMVIENKHEAALKPNANMVEYKNETAVRGIKTRKAACVNNLTGIIPRNTGCSNNPPGGRVLTWAA